MSDTAAPRQLLELELPPSPDAVPEARHRVVEALPCGGDREREAVRLLLSEIATNAVVHGGPGGDLGIRVIASGESIRIEVSCAGDGLVPRPRALEPDVAGGWGLFIVQKLASAWGVTSAERTTVWFELPCALAR